MSINMTRALLTVGCAAAVMTAAAALNAQETMRFQGMDTNRDGIIQKTEWRGSERAFANQDWNGDGQLSGPEVRPGARRNANWEEADHVPNRFERFVSWTQAGFTNLDHNRDRRITENEWHFDRETFRRVDANRDGSLSQAEFLGEGVDDARDASFDDLDWNNNGRVERTEWSGSPAAFNQLDRNRDGVLTRFEVVGGVNAPANDTAWDQFVSLDFDRNNALTRDEWHWSSRSFDQRDANRDGRLTRQEFAVAGGAPAAVGTTGAQRTVRVNSQQRWTDSGITVRAGDSITIDATGNIQMSDDTNDTATPAGSKSGRKAADAPVLNQPAGTLIAQIDYYGPIFVGARRTFTAPAAGRLYFGVNDDHLPDNRGEFAVNVSVTPR